MKYSFYDDQGVKLTAGSTNGVGSTTPAPGSQAMATYDRMDVGILALQQAYQALDIYDFRVPGDPNKATFQYKFPRAGYVLGVSLTGTISQTARGGIYVTKGDATSGMRTDVMGPGDAGNVQTYDTTNFPSLGQIVTAPSPIAYNKGDVAQMKWVSRENFPVTVNFAGFLQVALMPQ